MANPGTGYRTAGDLLLEMSFHLAQPGVYTSLTNPITAGAGVTATVGTTFYMYPGAQLVVEVPGKGRASAKRSTKSSICCAPKCPSVMRVATFIGSGRSYALPA